MLCTHSSHALQPPNNIRASGCDPITGYESVENTTEQDERMILHRDWTRQNGVEAAATPNTHAKPSQDQVASPSVSPSTSNTTGIARQTSGSAGSTVCDLCGRHFSRAPDMERHKDDVHGLGTVAYVCNQCPTTFRRKDKAMAHGRKPGHTVPGLDST